MAAGSRGRVRIGESLGSAWFLLLGILFVARLAPLLRSALAGGGFVDWATFVSRAGTALFVIIMAWLMLARPDSIAHRAGVIPWLTAMAGTYGAWVLGFLPKAELSAPLALLSAVVSLIGSGLILVVVLRLGKSFSLVPQARGLVTAGPYALVRHPLYAAEELALIGLAMHVVWYLSLPIVIGHVALQLQRMSYEEEVLTQVFPEYAAYARQTARWVPGIW
ncbi:MAG TPA: isoprenylcysteine carboxylmethyltransferase family protein [Caulobacteraceae bacterium]|jgi:protein-S-isoprenylcysteine O-methyltransferase Ste14